MMAKNSIFLYICMTLTYPLAASHVYASEGALIGAWSVYKGTYIDNRGVAFTQDKENTVRLFYDCGGSSSSNINFRRASIFLKIMDNRLPTVLDGYADIEYNTDKEKGRFFVTGVMLYTGEKYDSRDITINNLHLYEMMKISNSITFNITVHKSIKEPDIVLTLKNIVINIEGFDRARKETDKYCF